MGARINLLGQTFDRLTVIEETKERDKSGCIIWKCQCKCGNITFATSSALRSGHKRSCGCLNKEQVQQLGWNNLKDLTGQRFGKLLVLCREEGKTDNSHRTYWRCQCECGNIYIANGHQLNNGTLQSCGCLKSVGEQKIASLLQENNIGFEREKIFSDFTPYRYDFYVNNLYIIEYDGKQHFQDYAWGQELHTLEQIQKRDRHKNEYCFSKHIPIIRIPYTHLNKMTISDLLLDTTSFIVDQEDKND